MTYDQGSEVHLHETARRQTQHRHLLLRPSQSLGARLPRERQWPHSRVPSQGHGPEQCQLPTTRFHRTRPQQPPAQHPRLRIPSRGLIKNLVPRHRRCRASNLKPPPAPLQRSADRELWRGQCLAGRAHRPRGRPHLRTGGVGKKPQGAALAVPCSEPIEGLRYLESAFEHCPNKADKFVALFVASEARARLALRVHR